METTRRPAGRTTRRRFLAAAGAVPAVVLPRSAGARQPVAPLAAPNAPAFEFEEKTVVQLRSMLERGELTSERLTLAYLERIASIDRGPAGLSSVIEVNPEAEAIARASDAERRAGRIRGPLHGIPVLLKDNVETADRVATSAGSLALAGHRAKTDATVAARLRAGGAVILGKTNLSEWANFRSTRSSSGWSARGGQTRNPYALDRNPCGSSSGSGSATSANLCAVSIGTETDGSIVCPSSANGLVGVKPTVGLVSRAGIIPISHSQDTAGPMTRSVADAAAVLTAIAGPDPRDPISSEGASRALDYTGSLDAHALRGARLGVGRKFFGRDARVDRVVEDALFAMKGAGAELVDVDLSPGSDYGEAEYEVLLYEFKADLNAFLKTVDPALGATDLAALIEFNRRNADREMPFFGQEIFELSQAKAALDAPEYLRALETCRRLSRVEGIDRALTHGGKPLDAIVAPTGGPAWLTDHVNGDSFGGISSSQPPAVSGYPAITVPAGFIRGLPVGVTFLGRAWSESRLIALAYSFEQATKHRRAPELRASAV
jgi:amidase